MKKENIKKINLYITLIYFEKLHSVLTIVVVVVAKASD